MPTPAATFKSFDPGSFPRLSQQAEVRTGLYVLHKDWTKPILRPFSVQSIIDGDAANNAFSVNLAVPPGANHVCLHWLNQCDLSSAAASVSGVSAKIGTGLVTTHVLRLYGQVAPGSSDDRFGPYEAGLANAVTVDSAYGFWRPLAGIALTVNSNLALFDLATEAETMGLNYKVSSTRRLVVTPISFMGLVKTIKVSYGQFATEPASTGATNMGWNKFDAAAQSFALHGSSRIMLVPEYFGTAETTTLTATATSGTATVDWSAIGATFQS